MTALPRVIHQTWFGPKEPPHAYMNTWRKRNPGWTYRLWRDGDAELFPLRNQDGYDWFTRFNIKSDFARWELVHRFGGVYVDADIICLRPLDDYLPRFYRDAWASQDCGWPSLVCSGVMGATAGHPFAAAMVEALARVPRTSKTIHGGMTTGQGLVTKVLDAGFRDQVQVVPREVFLTRAHVFPTLPAAVQRAVFAINADLGRHRQDPSRVVIDPAWLVC